MSQCLTKGPQPFWCGGPFTKSPQIHLVENSPQPGNLYTRAGPSLWGALSKI